MTSEQDDGARDDGTEDSEPTDVDVVDDPNAVPDTDPVEPSTGVLNTPSSGAGAAPGAGGVTHDSTPTSDIPDPGSDDEADSPSDFAPGGYDDRQLDGTREAVIERAQPDDAGSN